MIVKTTVLKLDAFSPLKNENRFRVKSRRFRNQDKFENLLFVVETNAITTRLADCVLFWNPFQPSASNRHEGPERDNSPAK